QAAFLLAAVLLGGLVLAIGRGAASTPAKSSVTVPTTAGQTVTDIWTGTIQPGANAASDCAPPSSSPVDEHVVTVNVPSGAYDSIDAAFAFSITWTPGTPTEDTADELLTVIAPAGQEVGSSGGSRTTDQAVGR